MRVLFIARSFTDEPTDGVQTRVFKTCTFLAKKGIYIDIICDPLYSKVAEPRNLDDNLRLITVPKLPHDFGPFAYSIMSLKCIHDVLRKSKYDIVHGQAYANSFGAAILKESHNAFPPLVITVDDIYSLDRSQVFNIMSSLTRRIRNFIYLNTSFVFDKISLRVADHLITVSENTKKELMEIFNYKNDSITVIRNGVDIREFSPSNRDDNIKSFFGAEKIVLTVGHLAYRKGIDVLIRAAASILQIFPEVKFVIVGTGEDLAFYRRLSEILGVSRSVCFVGRVSSQFLRKLYATADVFVLPSRYEGQPISILEAMASGCPVVLSRISDIDTYITNYETGLLVPPEDTSALASAIIELLTNENLSKRIRERALTYVRDHFDWSSVADRHIKLYEELIQQENKQKLYSEKD